MKVLEYLQKKYNKKKPSTMSYHEAYVFGVEYPLIKGWLSRCSNVEITNLMCEALAGKIELKAKRKEASGGNPMSSYTKRGLSLLRQQSGPVTIISSSQVVTAQPLVKPMKAKKVPKQYTGPYIDPNGSDFLSSYQWRTLRFDAIALHGNSCQCCGATPMRGNGVVINVDHVKPRKTHPHLALDINNLQILCDVCNHGKSNRHETDFRPTSINTEDSDLGCYSMDSIGSFLRSL